MSSIEPSEAAGAEPGRARGADRLRLPSLPAVVLRVRALVAAGRAGTGEIGEVVASDPPLAARVLRIANSVHYGLRERCLSTARACTVLGLRRLETVVLQAGVLQHYEHLRRHPGFDLDELWRHSILTAQVCAFTARRCGVATGLRDEEAYTLGLLHDIGKVVLLDGLGEEYLDVIAAARLLHLALEDLERSMLGIDHSEVGALVAERWGLPPEVGAAIRHHHGPRERVVADPAVALVAHANLLAGRVAAGDLDSAQQTFDAPTLDLLGLPTPAAQAVVEHAIAMLPLVEI